MKKILFGLFLGAVGLTSCSGKKIIPDGSDRVTKNNISIWSSWVKNKSDKFDVRLHIANDSEKDVIILLSEMHCFRGTIRGELKHTFFNTGERTIDFRPRETKEFNLVCRTNENAEGDFKIVVGHVYANPQGDGKTRGDAIAKDLEWKVVDAKN